MGVISKVHYEEIKSSVYSMEDSGEFYFFYNLLGVDDQFQDAYEEREMKQLSVRDKIVSDLRRSGSHPKLNTTIIGASSLRDSVVIVVEQ